MSLHSSKHLKLFDICINRKIVPIKERNRIIKLHNYIFYSDSIIRVINFIRFYSIFILNDYLHKSIIIRILYSLLQKLICVK